MTTREQLQAEAAELYPVLNWDPYHQESVETYGYEECQQEAHIRAKTVTAEQVEAAAEGLKPGPGIANEMGIRHSYYVDKARRTLEAAGFYVEADHE